MEFNPNDKAQRRYVDSPVLADILMSVMAVVLGIATWSCFTQASPQYVAGAVMGLFCLLCAFGVVSQKRRTFTFDKASQTMSWSSKALGENTSGAVAFKDVSIYLDSMRSNRTDSYRVMIETPQGTWPLTAAYRGGLQRAEARAAEIRTMLGQSSATPQGTSSSDATIAGKQAGESAPQAFIRITRG